jgi:hypothetical protein
VFSFNNNGSFGQVGRTIAGVTGSFLRPAWQAPGVFSGLERMTVNRSGAGTLAAGNTIEGDLHPWLANFSTAFTFAEIDLPPPAVVMSDPGGSAGTFIDMWSGPGGSGDLLARVEVVPGDVYSGSLSVHAPGGTSAQSLTFGRFVAGDPDCSYRPADFGPVVSCGQFLTQGFAARVRIAPVPEPTAALVFAVALAIVARSARRSG